MGSAVEAVATNLVLLVELIRQSVHVMLRRHGLMERGIKYSYLRDILAHNVLARADTDQVCRVVQRSQRNASLDCLDNFIIDEDGISKVLAAVYDTMTNSINFGHGLDNAPLLVNQDVDDSADCIGMILHRNVCLVLFFLVRVGVGQTTINTNSLAQALSQNSLVVHVEELILQGRAARIDYQNIHFSLVSFIQ